MMFKKQCMGFRWAILAVIFAQTAFSASMNLFMLQPYDVLVKPQRPPWCPFQVMVGYEAGFHTRGFMGDDDLCMTSVASVKGNVLQLYQKKQDALAAFKGFDFTTNIGSQSQFFNKDDDNTSHGLFVPCGKLQVPLNLLLGFQFQIPCNITCAAYIPYRYASLTEVVWREKRDGLLFEDVSSPPLIKTLENIGNINLRGWKRHGFGDLMLQVEYYFHRPQPKLYLKNVGIELRGGILVPTGLQENSNQLLAFPFGYDAGAGVLGAARLELWFVHQLRFSIDAEILYLFGNTKCRRIKTDPAQTDLLLLTEALAFKEPGFLQHFTLFLDTIPCNDSGFSVQCAYQFTKQMEDKLFLCSEAFESSIAQQAENLQERTAHSIMFKVKYALAHCSKDSTLPSNPSFALFYRHAFNGKRTILADTIGFTISVPF